MTAAGFRAGSRADPGSAAEVATNGTRAGGARDFVCLYCEGAEFAPLVSGVRDRAGVVPGEFTYVRCVRCGSAMLSPSPRASDVPGFYPRVYSFAPDLAAGWRQVLARMEYSVFYRPSYRAEAWIVDRLCRRASGGRRGSVLDVGCGRGLRLLEFRRLGYEVHGCDFQPESVDYLNSRLAIPARQGDVATVDSLYASESFDVITAFHLLEHLPDPGRAIRAFRSLLRPGGLLVVCLPLADSVQARVLGRRWAAFTEAPRHISLPSRAALATLLHACGFVRESMAFRGDDVLSCAAEAGLSLVPAGCTGRAYGTPGAGAMIGRLLGALASVACIPWALVDQFLLRRPAHGILVACRPAGI
jgi:SAM-dependent methyltransferase